MSNDVIVQDVIRHDVIKPDFLSPKTWSRQQKHVKNLRIYVMIGLKK